MSGEFEVREDLSLVNRENGFDGFEFDNESRGPLWVSRF